MAEKEKLNSISWNVYGKITHIDKSPTVTGDAIGIDYLYDPNGNRVEKSI